MKRNLLIPLAVFALSANVMGMSEEDMNKMTKERYEVVNLENEAEEIIEWQYEVVITYYSTLDVENGFGAIDALGNKLTGRTIAIPREMPLGTTWEFEGFKGTFSATDRGSPKHIRTREDGVLRIDMCIERLKGESDSAYWSRVNMMGKTTTKARIIE